MGQRHEFQSGGAKSQPFLDLYILFGNIKNLKYNFRHSFDFDS